MNIVVQRSQVREILRDSLECKQYFFGTLNRLNYSPSLSTSVVSGSPGMTRTEQLSPAPGGSGIWVYGELVAKEEEGIS